MVEACLTVAYSSMASGDDDGQEQNMQVANVAGRPHIVVDGGMVERQCGQRRAVPR